MTERCLWLDHGRLIMDGPSKEVTEAYLARIREEATGSLQAAMNRRLKSSQKAGAAELTRLSLSFLGQDDDIAIFEVFENVQFNIGFVVHQPLQNPDVHLAIENMDGNVLMQSRLSSDLGPLEALPAGRECSLALEMPHCGLNKGVYGYVCTIFDGEAIAAQSRQGFEVLNTRLFFPVFSLFHTESDFRLQLIKEGKNT
jgi:lipopolysaccharide transport system ATP-binding protein